MNDERAHVAPSAMREAVMTDGESVTAHLGAGQSVARPADTDASGSGAAAQQWPTDLTEPNKLGSRVPRHREGRRRSPLWR